MALVAILCRSGPSGVDGRQFDSDGRKNDAWALARNLLLLGLTRGSSKVTPMQVSPTALRALDALRINQRDVAKAAEVLATGQRVNSAADDAASLDMGRLMTSQYRGIFAAVRNIHDGLSLTQTAEAALDSIGQSLQRMHELAVQAATGTLNDTQRGHLDIEYQAHNQQIESVVQTTRWNGYRLLRELSPSSFDVQAGPDSGRTIPIVIPKVYADGSLIGFPNGDFENSPLGATSVSGWTVTNNRVKLDGSSQIGGWPTPTDPTLPTNLDGSVGPGESTPLSVSGSMTTQIVSATGNPTGGTKALQLLSSGMRVSQGYGIVHGPYVISNSAVSIASGESVSFDWKAENGDDWFDVYAYLLNVDTGATVELLDQTGATTGWSTVNKTIPTSGNYKFVFVSGTYDFSGGRALGARLTVDNISAPPTAKPNLTNTTISSRASADEAMSQIDKDLGQALQARAALAASRSRLTHAADQLMNHTVHLSAARSSQLDADYADATQNLARGKVLENAASSVLSQIQTLDQTSSHLVRSNENLFRA